MHSPFDSFVLFVPACSSDLSACEHAQADADRSFVVKRFCTSARALSITISLLQELRLDKVGDLIWSSGGEDPYTVGKGNLLFRDHCNHLDLASERVSARVQMSVDLTNPRVSLFLHAFTRRTCLTRKRSALSCVDSIEFSYLFLREQTGCNTQCNLL